MYKCLKGKEWTWNLPFCLIIHWLILWWHGWKVMVILYTSDVFFVCFFFSTLISKSLSKIIVYSPLDSIRSTFVESMRCQGLLTFNLLLWACEWFSLSTCRLGIYITSWHLVLLLVHIQSLTGFTQCLSMHLTQTQCILEIPHVNSF